MVLSPANFTSIFVQDGNVSIVSKSSSQAWRHSFEFQTSNLFLLFSLLKTISPFLGSLPAILACYSGNSIFNFRIATLSCYSFPVKTEFVSLFFLGIAPLSRSTVSWHIWTSFSSRNSISPLNCKSGRSCSALHAQQFWRPLWHWNVSLRSTRCNLLLQCLLQFFLPRLKNN